MTQTFDCEFTESSEMNVFDVKRYGAVGNNSADDTIAIQAAINAAAAAGLAAGGAEHAGVVFFPPGVYKVTASLQNGVGGRVVLRGSGKYGTLIVGSFTGYLIDQADANTGKIEGIEDLYVKNTSNVDGNGAIRFQNSQGGFIRNCYIQGFNGIDASSNTYSTRIEGCEVTSTANAGTANTVGIYAAQVSIYSCRFTGFDVGIQAFNVGVIICGCATEQCNTGTLIGKDRSDTNSNLVGGQITSHSTERCNTAIDLVTGSGLLIDACSITGTSDVQGNVAVASITWSGGTATLTTASPHGFALGARGVTVSGATPSGYNGSFACTVTSTTQLTYSVSDPGGSASVPGQVTGLPTYGIIVRNFNNLVVAGLSVSARCWLAGIDIHSTTGGHIAFIGAGSGVSPGSGVDWNMPTVNESFFSYTNCNNPTDEFVFAHLPSTAAAGRVTGRQYNISDATISGKAIGDAITVGGSTGHIAVRWNGSAWTWAA